MQCTGAVAIRESVRDFSNELLRLETDPCRIERVKTLANQRKLFKNPCSQAELNKIVPFGFSLQRQKNGVFFAIKIV